MKADKLRGPQGKETGVLDSWVSKKSGHSASLAPTPLGLSRSTYYLLNNYFCVGEGRSRMQGRNMKSVLLL